MMISAAGDPDRYEAELAAQQARARRRLRVVSWTLLGGGALCVILAVALAMPVREHAGLFGVLMAVGLALDVAGVVVQLQLRSSSGLEAADDFLGRLAPRLLGGRKPEDLDTHRRRRRSRRSR